ncbi:MAG: glycoside hydrolase family 127 protein [Siphonobacter sp.]
MKQVIRTFLIAGLTLSSLLAQSQSKDYPIQPVPFTAVKVEDTFWAPRIKRNHEVTIPIALAHCYKTGRVNNFRLASHEIAGNQFCTEYPFDDTDIYKIIEGASYSIQMIPDARLSAQLDTLITYVGAAQEPDGYLYTARTINPLKPHEWAGTNRWEKESDLSHELYNSGHLIEAAVAHYQATGKTTFLNIAIRNADLLCRTFGPGKLAYAPGHQIIEMALVKLYRVTNQKKYLDLAKFLLDVRGKGKEYSQDHMPVTQQTEAVGHSVRATYMYSGMADIAAITGDEQYVKAIDRIWEDVVTKKLYITGGIGSEGGHEGFGKAYRLPNMSAYNETCAAIGNVYWNQRLFLLHGDAKYYDVLERTLYNGLISGVSLTGDHFFYPNPLQSKGQHARSAWFGCACCPSNICRFIPSVSGYVYGLTPNRVYANLYMSSTASLTIHNQPVRIKQETDYPWKGKIRFTIQPAQTATFEFALRIPGWAHNQPIPSELYTFEPANLPPVSVTVNGKKVKYTQEKGYAVLTQTWKTGDVIELTLPMPIRRVLANPQVKEDQQRVALQQGPIVYCAEWPEYPTGKVTNLVLTDNQPLQPEFEASLLGGVNTLKGKALQTKQTASQRVETSQTPFKAIPYYAWANRGNGEMTVWLARTQSAAQPTPLPTIASKSTLSASYPTKTLIALQDQAEPKNSNDHDNIYYHWWPKKDTTQWVQYTFAEPTKVSKVQVYWFDDAPWGGCRIPSSWQLLYQTESGDWKPVTTSTPYSVAKDQYNILPFDPVQTNALRMVIQLPKEYSSGILEWKVE